jgi:hypothetical protein
MMIATKPRHNVNLCTCNLNLGLIDSDLLFGVEGKKELKSSKCESRMKELSLKLFLD